MTPVLRKFIFKNESEEASQEYIIKEKNYGEMTLYDVFFEDIFLCALSEEGKVLLTNLECVKSKQVGLNEEMLDKLNAFVASKRCDGNER